VRIEAWQWWGGVGQSFQEDLVRSKSRMFCDRNKTMMMQNSRTVRRSVDANEQARARAETTPLRNEAQLNCVSLRSQRDDEVTGGAVKGQDEPPFRAPLPAPPVTKTATARASCSKRRRRSISRPDPNSFPPALEEFFQPFVCQLEFDGLLAIRFAFFSDTSCSLLDRKPPAASLGQGEIDFCISYTSSSKQRDNLE
jgi:hypothetical protein